MPYRVPSVAPILLLLGFLITAPLSQSLAQQSARDLLRSTHVHGLAVDRSDSGRLLIATHHGLYALRTEGGAVTLLSERRDDFMGFTPHPGDASILYASGHPAQGGNLGFVISKDAGRSWERLAPGVGGPVDFHQMDISKTDPKVIYGVHGALQVSRDGGATWQKVGPVPRGLIDLAVSAADSDRLYAATQEGLSISHDGGRSWLTEGSSRQPVSTVQTATQGVVYLFRLGSGLLRAQEPAMSWQSVSNEFGDRYLLHLAIDPGNEQRLFAATQHNELLASEDGGVTWQLVAAP